MNQRKQEIIIKKFKRMIVGVNVKFLTGKKNICTINTCLQLTFLLNRYTFIVYLLLKIIL